VATGLTAACLLSLVAGPVLGQLQPGDPRKIYPGADIASRPKPPLNPDFTHGVKVLPGGGYGYGGGGIIIVNGQPCYAPNYYGGYYGGYNGYASSGVSVGVNVGGLSLGYRQANGYYNYNQVPPAVSYGNNYGNQVNGYPNDSRGYSPRTPDRQDSADQAGSRRTPPPLKTGEDEANDNYLNRKPSPLQKDPTLAQAVRDIETAFRNSDIRPLEKHLDANAKLTLMSMGRTRRQLDVSAYIDMTKDAFTNMKTTSYTLDKVEPASGGAWMAYGKHVLKADNGTAQTFNVGFVLKKVTAENSAERWIITEVSADPAK
jgi:hypothetical protein